MKPDQTGIRQLRIELLVRSDIERFLNSAVQLAKIMDIELEAIFIQDQGMLNAAALPLVQEVCLWTAEERVTSTTLLSKGFSTLRSRRKAPLPVTLQFSHQL